MNQSEHMVCRQCTRLGRKRRRGKLQPNDERSTYLIIGRLPTAHIPRTLRSHLHMRLVRLLLLLLLKLLLELPHLLTVHDSWRRLLRDAGLILVGELRHVVDQGGIEVVRKHGEE